MNENKRKFVAGLITGLIVFGALTFYATVTRAVAPSVTYAFPSNNAQFVDVWRGHGVNITVNVTDADNDLNQVVLQWNNSGTWETFYDSGSLGGVAYHNVTVLNSNFTGSWETYEWQICAYDTAWTNTTYKFTTEYVFGDPHVIWYDDNANYGWATMYKNASGEYYLALHDDTGNDVEVLTSSNGMDWVKQTITVIDATAQDDIDAGVWGWFNYEGKPSFLYVDDGEENQYVGYWMIASFNGFSWSSVSTGIVGRGYYYNGKFYRREPIGADICYYDGTWQLIIGVCGASTSTPVWSLKFYSGTPPNSWQEVATLCSYSSYVAAGVSHFNPNLNILDGMLILTYQEDEDGAGANTYGDFHWQVYDGISLTNKGDVSTDNIEGLSVTKDPVNEQLVAVYVKVSDGCLYYRILEDPDGSWSDEHLLYQVPSGATIKNPDLNYIDDRLVLTFSMNWRGKYAIYMMTAPDYMSLPQGGVLQQYNKIQFPDATPNQEHVNSSVFYFENINSRNINWINWSFSDIGSIQCENNIRLWGSTDNATWTAIRTTDANGYINMTTTTWAGGLPWQAGDKRYFKIEILDIGAVPEDLHSVDEGIILKVGLA